MSTERDPSDPSNLDADNDGQACEDYPYGTTGVSPQGDDAGFARCDFFLHVVRDDQGGVRHQYRGDELIVGRFEQCFSEDVLTDTIVNSKLADTGGPPLLVLGALGITLVGAGIVVARRR